MSNRFITQVASDAGFFAAIIFNHALNKLDRIIVPDSGDTSRVKVLGSNYIPLCFNDKQWIIDTDTYVDLDDDLDTSTKTFGTDYYVYACDDNGSLIFLISANSTYPSGYSTVTSRKIGGFHTLCIDVGTISGHTLTGFTAKSVLPDSVWDLKHRPICEPEGMVYCKEANIWVDIYLYPGSSISYYGGTIVSNRTWLTVFENVASFGSNFSKRLLTDVEFGRVAYYSNEQTNVVGSTIKTTAGGWSDIAGRRMISDIGCEDCCGQYQQWLSTPSLNFSVGSTGAWHNQSLARGEIYSYGTSGVANSQLIAGGMWTSGTNSGSQSRAATVFRDSGYAYLAERYCAPPL